MTPQPRTKAEKKLAQRINWDLWELLDQEQEVQRDKLKREARALRFRA